MVAFFLAAVPELTPQEHFNIYLWIAISGGASTLLVFLKIWDFFRPKPPVAEALETFKAAIAKELAGTYATKADLLRLEQQIMQISQQRTENVRALHDKIDLLAKSIGAEFMEVMRSIGKLEGKTE